jgi:hypothetical protein
MKKQVGDRVTARDTRGKVIWQPKILKIAKLRAAKDFEPTIMLVQHKDGRKELYFPYWKRTRKGTQGFANRPPMFNERIFLELLTDAVRQAFFTRSFSKNLAIELEKALRN